METKKINRLMLGIFLLHIAVVIFLMLTAGRFHIGIILNLSLGEIILLLPALVYLLFYRLQPQKDGEEKEPMKTRLYYNRVKPSTLAYTIIFTLLSMPLTTLINAISMLFVDNTILSMTEVILELPFLLMLFLMAIVPACCEELVFRGITYGGYRKNGTKFMAVMLSALMFGLMHMNLNQALYAFAIGIFLALLMEATGSVWPTMLFHFIYNAQSCCLMFFMDALMPAYYQNAANMRVTQEELFMVISVYLVIAAIFTPFAFCMLYKIAKNENRVEELTECLPKKQHGRGKLVTVSLVLATVIAAAYIIWDMIITALMI